MKLLAIVFLLAILEVYCKVAIIVHGPAEEVSNWLKLYREMDSIHDNEENIHEHAVLFALSTTSELSHSDCESRGIKCIHHPVSNWVEARNNVIKHVFYYEKNDQIDFKYWLFIDSNLHEMSCHAHNRGTIDHQSTNCFARFIHFLLARTSYAQVFLGPMLTEELEVQSTDCGSRHFQAIHRAAVPILLPYVNLESLSSEEKDSEDAHKIQSLVAMGCLPQGTISSGMLKLSDPNFPVNLSPTSIFSTNNDRNFDRRLKIAKQRYSDLVPSPIYLARSCGKPSDSFVVSNAHTNSSAEWRNSGEFHRCLKSLKPKFLKAVEKLN